MTKTTVKMIKEELELYIKSSEITIRELEKDGISCDYTYGYRDAMKQMLNKIKGEEKMYSRDYK